jgi:hypothetical protein
MLIFFPKNCTYLFAFYEKNLRHEDRTSVQATFHPNRHFHCRHTSSAFRKPPMARPALQSPKNLAMTFEGEIFKKNRPRRQHTPSTCSKASSRKRARPVRALDDGQALAVC